MKPLRLFAFWFVGCFFAVPAAAIILIPPCDLRGVGHISVWNPRPQSTDEIPFKSLATLDLVPGTVVMFKVDRPSSNIVTVDMVTTTNPNAFPGYERSDLPLVQGTLGQFAPGTYDVSSQTRSHDATTGAFAPICQGMYARSLKVFADSGQAPVVEYYNATLDHYFMTQNRVEMHDLDTGVHAGWVRTGQSFSTYVPGATIYGNWTGALRYYGLPSAGLDTHFYTYGGTEQIALTIGPYAKDWILETQNAFEVSPPNFPDGACFESAPVYRVWNNRIDSNHRYTTKREIRDAMVAAGWIAEGRGDDAVVMCVPSQSK